MYDVAIIGGGTGGYTAAIRAAKKGLKVLLIEKEKLGGTCLHKGCIPTKAMLEFSELFSKINNKAGEWGIQLDQTPSLNIEKMMKKKENIINQLHQGIQFLMNKNQVDLLEGTGKIQTWKKNKFEIEVATSAQVQVFRATQVIVATGSRPFIPRSLNQNRDKVMTSDDILNLKQFPKSIAIIGGGVIGVEFTTFFNELECQVHLIEREEDLLPSEDIEIRKEMKRLFKRNKVNLHLNHEVELDGIVEKDNRITIPVVNKATGQKKEIQTDIILVAIGRQNNIHSLGLEQLNVDLSAGYIPINEYMETNFKGLYAIGDITGTYQLAHVAAHQGIIAIDHMTQSEVEPYQANLVPRCVYSHPEIASIGLTEQEAKSKGLEVKTGKFSFKGIGRAVISSQTDGFVKIVTDAKTDQVVGVHMIGEKATELIGESALGMLLEATSWEFSLAVHPHPSLNEIYGEGALAVNGQEING